MGAGAPLDASSTSEVELSFESEAPAVGSPETVEQIPVQSLTSERTIVRRRSRTANVDEPVGPVVLVPSVLTGVGVEPSEPLREQPVAGLRANAFIPRGADDPITVVTEGTGARDPVAQSIAAELRANNGWSRRPPPRLLGNETRGFTYHGPSVVAEIEPDGTVQFSDSFAHADGIGASMDLNGMVMRAQGRDPNLSEKLWFLRQTEELRNQLADRHRQRELNAGIRRLRSRISAIVDDASRDAEQKLSELRLIRGSIDNEVAFEMVDEAIARIETVR